MSAVPPLAPPSRPLCGPGPGNVAPSVLRVPEGVDGRAVQLTLLREHGIEVGGGLGPDFPPIWRVGLMGVNATVETADRVLEALDAVLAHAPTGARIAAS